MVYSIFMDTFSALADPNRRRIIELIASSGHLTATDISDKFKISAPAISQHLKVLREAQLVDMEKKAQQRIYTINTSSFDDVEAWIQQMKKVLGERYNRLDTLLEKMMKGGEK